jgi:hypothetical protein
MNIIKDQITWELTISLDDKTYLRRWMDGNISWLISAGYDISRDERMWVYANNEETVLLEEKFKSR